MALCLFTKVKLVSQPLLQPNSSLRPKLLRTFQKYRNNKSKPGFESISSPFANTNVSVNDIKYNKLLKPLLFAGVFTGCTFTAAAIWQYENIRAHAISMLKKPYGLIQKQGESSLREIRKVWDDLTPGEKVFIPICSINILVFLAWRIPKFQPMMLRYFCSNPASTSSCWPMLLSTFSHYSLFHLMANMYVLHSFSTGAVAALGKEQFIALYLSAGVISSLTSYIYKVITKQPGLSLGASGAIMAILGYVCTQYPDTKLGIILLPFFTFSAGSAIKVILGLDAAGCIMGWKIFDHAAHLGGALCGITWALWGNDYIWKKRDPVLEYWHELRGAVK